MVNILTGEELDMIVRGNEMQLENNINYYLTDMPTDIINKHGLSKTLLTRRETIFLKHVFKNVFVLGNEEELNKKLEMLNFKSLFDYVTFVTNKLRGIYKFPREYEVEDADKIVKQSRKAFCKTLELYKGINPIVILDFDKTITNKKFHSLYNWLIYNKYEIIINSANPSRETIVNYLKKHDLKVPSKIYANKGKKKKITKMKDLVFHNLDRVFFYIDDEQEYLDYASLLFVHTYLYTKSGKLYNRTIFKK